MTAVHIAYSRSRALFRGVVTVFLMVSGFFLIFFSIPRVPGISEVSGAGVAHADAPADPACPYPPTVDYNGNVLCIDPACFSYVDPGCGCGCGCGF